MSRVIRTLTGSTTTVISVRRGLMVSIMTMIPTIVTRDVMICVRLCCSVVAMLSMSFVTRLMISPCVLPS